jgi:two-component system response regulator AlgR
VKNRDGQHFVKLKECDKQLEISRRHLPTVRKILRDMHLPEL